MGSLIDSENLTMYIVDQGYLVLATSILELTETNIYYPCLLGLSNIVVTDENVKNFILTEDIFDKVLSMMSHSILSIQREASFVITNLLTSCEISTLI